MSVHDSEGDKMYGCINVKRLFFFGGGGAISRPIYLSSHKKDVVLILAVADGCNHQMTSHYKRFKRHRTTATPKKNVATLQIARHFLL